MKPTAFDRLIAMLPPDRRAAAAVSLVGMSDDPDGPIATLYSEIFERLERAKREQRTDHEAREKLLLGQLEKLRETNQETIRSEVGRLHHGKFWHRMLFSRVAAIVAGLAVVAVAMPIVTRHVILAGLAAHQQALQATQADTIHAIQTAQTEGTKLAEIQRCAIERINQLLAANVSRKSFQEAIGNAINTNSTQLKTTVGPEVVTLRIQDALTRKEQGVRIIEIKHGLTPDQFDTLRKTVDAANTISIPK
jgi:hypothetical protein